MNPALIIRQAGPGVTLQDGGRSGYLRFGVTGAGPMDPLALATANLAAGMPADAAAIEVSLGGLDLSVEGRAVAMAVAGGSFRITLDGRPLPPAARFTLEPGAMLSIRSGEAGAWCYLAIAGRFDLPPVLGSLSTHSRSGLGGLEGRMLRAGDRLPLLAAQPAGEAPHALVVPWLDRSGTGIRVVLGPQDDFFDAEEIAAFLKGPWRISARADRMAYLLEGPKLSHSKGFNIVSDGITHGAIQVPGEGQPIVLMADRQPTGGYPKIATIIGPDLGKIAQFRPGSRFQFTAVSLGEAVAARRKEAEALAKGIKSTPLVRTVFTSDFLLGTNLISGVCAK
jgi:biotin-dependent carboxylase-like uncharacterized protein